MFGFENVGKFLILVGVFLVLFGVFFAFWHKIPFLGRLPGDIVFQKDGFFFFFPLVTSLVISLILTILINFVFRLFR
ncbi:MAG: DUF2905 domain-containing protein [Dehalococcoidales bacterium]